MNFCQFQLNEFHIKNTIGNFLETCLLFNLKSEKNDEVVKPVIGIYSIVRKLSQILNQITDALENFQKVKSETIL